MTPVDKEKFQTEALPTPGVRRPPCSSITTAPAGFWYSGVPAPRIPFFSQAPGFCVHAKGRKEQHLWQVRASTKSFSSAILAKIPNSGPRPAAHRWRSSRWPPTIAYKDKEGQWQDRTEWHNITAWARTAEIAGEYLKKGSKVYIEGSLRTHSWDDKQTGQKKYMTEIIVNDLVLLGGRGEAGGGGDFAGSFARLRPREETTSISGSGSRAGDGIRPHQRRRHSFKGRFQP